MGVGDPIELVNLAYSNHAKLQEKAENARFLGGISVGGFGIPNQFLGLDLRTAGQKADQARPAMYLDQMLSLIKKVDEALDASIALPKS